MSVIVNVNFVPVLNSNEFSREIDFLEFDFIII